MKRNLDADDKGGYSEHLADTVKTGTIKETRSTRPTQASYPNTVTVIQY